MKRIIQVLLWVWRWIGSMVNSPDPYYVTVPKKFRRNMTPEQIARYRGKELRDIRKRMR